MRRDALWALLTLAGGLVLLAGGAYVRRGVPEWVLVGPLVVTCAGVVVRRRAPLVGLGLGGVAITADLLVGPSLGTVLVFTDNLYAATLYGPARLTRPLLWVAAALAVLAGAVSAVVAGDWGTLPIAGVQAGLVLTTPVITALIIRQYRDAAAAERVRAEQVARLAELDRDAAVNAERTRMARELHDMIANHFSAIAIQSSAVLSREDLDQDAVRQVLRSIRENSVQGLAEMRTMIELLRRAGDKGGGGEGDVDGHEVARQGSKEGEEATIRQDAVDQGKTTRRGPVDGVASAQRGRAGGKKTTLPGLEGRQATPQRMTDEGMTPGGLGEAETTPRHTADKGSVPGRPTEAETTPRCGAEELAPGGPAEAKATPRRTADEGIVPGLVEAKATPRRMADEGMTPGELVEAEATRRRLVDAGELVGRAEEAGVRVVFRVEGEPRELPPAIDLAGYRILQESLTNVLKHGHGDAEVLVGYHPGLLIVTVWNTGPGDSNPAPNRAPEGARAGLIGMRERALLAGGTFAAGPYGGGWRVRAELPTGEDG